MILTKTQEEIFIKKILNTILNSDELCEHFSKMKILEECQTNIVEDMEKYDVAFKIRQETDEIEHVNFESTLDSIIKRLDAAANTSNIIQARLTEIEHALNIRNTAKNSKSPWAEIVATDYDQQTGQLRTTVDWNDAFIQSLISYGFRGKDDNEIISLWLTSLYHNFSGNKQ